MNIDVHWVNEERSVLYCSFSGDWDWKVFYETIEQPTLFNETHSPCLLVDLRGIDRMPIDAVLHLKRASQIVTKIEGAVVIIATSASILMTYQVLSTIYKPLAAKMRIVSSEQEAQAILGFTV